MVRLLGSGRLDASLAAGRQHRLLEAALVLVSVAALVISLTRGVAPSTITGIGAGALLLGYSVMALIRAVRT
jgi:hypothetical protein